MSQDRPLLRVFISSPDDVQGEREATRRVVARLAREFRYTFDLEAVMWEWRPLLADDHFQAQILPPRETDVTVVILWSLLGTPLPVERFPGPLSQAVVTGTEWEFEDAIASMRANHTPKVLVYRKRGAQVSWPDDRPEEREEGLRQLRLVEDFFRRWFAGRPDGQVDVAVRNFPSTAAFEELVQAHLRELLTARLGAGAAPVRWHAGSPYRGLESFDPEHAEIFFGRSRAGRELRDRLERRLADGLPFVTVLGASGSGKSSLVKAGLIPDLAAGSWLGRIGLSRHALLRPADDERDPLDALARALMAPAALPELAQHGFATAPELAALLRNDPASAARLIAQTLRDVASQAPPRAHQRAALLIVVDQLEELFTSPLSPDARETFVRVLETLARTSAAAELPEDAPPILVVATLRSDFFGQLDQLPRLARLVEGDGQCLLLAPDEHEIGQMIRLPAALAGVRFERDEERELGLDDEILAIALRDTRVLPLLSFVLDQLWQERSEKGLLTFEAYHRMGGLEGALAERAEGVLAGLPAVVQHALPHLLGALVHAAAESPAGEEAGGSARFTARWLPLERFAPESPERRLIEALMDPAVRLLVAEGDRAETRVRVAHEALLTHWRRARDLLEADRDDLLLIERLEEAERLWREAQGDQHAGRLLPAGLPLTEAGDLLARRRERLAAGLVEFIEASLAAERARVARRSRRARWLIGTFATLSLVASALGLVAWRQKQEADDQTLLAQTNEARAEAQERIATQRANDVLSLSASKDLEDLVARAESLWPPYPDLLDDYEGWMAEARELLEGRPAERGSKERPSLAEHEAKLAELRARALPLSEEEARAQRESHPRFAELGQKGAELQWRSRMLRLEPWPDEAPVEDALAREDRPEDANGLNSLARPLVDPDQGMFGQEVRALLLARRALVAAGEKERPLIRDTLAWALFRVGRFQEALTEERVALEEAAEEAKEEYAGYVAKLEESVGAWTGAEALAARRAEHAGLLAEVADLEGKVNERRTWEFADPEDRWWHVQLAKLVSDLEALQDPEQGLMGDTVSEAFGWGVRKRLDWAASVEERTRTGDGAAAKWAACLERIATNDKYARLTLAPQVGLVPLGPDADSGLEEFGHPLTGSVPERGADEKLALTEDMGLVFVLIPAGTFWMGAQKDDPSGRNYYFEAKRDESPVHEVELSAFFLSKYEMTQGQWQRIAGSNPSNFGPNNYRPSWNREEKGWSGLLPVEQVKWTDCVETCARLGLVLPSEAQWEYGARAGSPSSVYWCGDDPTSLRGVANLADEYAQSYGGGVDWSLEAGLDDGHTATAEIATYRANAFGLHDVHGNVWEWCSDGNKSGFYGRSPLKDPVADPAGSSARVYRGGGFNDAAVDARSAGRGSRAPVRAGGALGLRPARTIAP